MWLMNMRELNAAIIELSSESAVCSEAQSALYMAWWHTEDMIRKETGRCSAQCGENPECPCCRFYALLYKRLN